MCAVYGRSFELGEWASRGKICSPSWMDIVFVCFQWAYNLSARTLLLFPAPPEVEPRGMAFHSPHAWSLCCFHGCILCPAVQPCVCLVFVEVPWHYNFKAVQKMEVISSTSWMNREGNQGKKGVLQSCVPLLWEYIQKNNMEGIVRSVRQRHQGKPFVNKETNTTIFLDPPPLVLKCPFKTIVAGYRTSTREKQFFF